MAQKPSIQSFKLDEQGLTQIFGELEAKLMEAVWTLDQPTVQDVIDHLGGQHNYKTTMTVLNRLVDKGILRRRKAGRAFTYAGATSREELLATVFDKMVRGMFGSEFRQIALAQMIETAEEIDESLLEDISRLIEKRKQADE
ncbi:MAG TPA: BlaI/MecI/CopY family transcriptional regulator [Anaerolineae bacterium]|nr:BlaI/MecI/CopY family transcriptional regulator [Anaerolineae bacterium]HMR62476.1 BlaI/MecI/CopY family transcriptional regulator [Anaerolineae bacterium]